MKAVGLRIGEFVVHQYAAVCAIKNAGGLGGQGLPGRRSRSTAPSPCSFLIRSKIQIEAGHGPGVFIICRLEKFAVALSAPTTRAGGEDLGRLARCSQALGHYPL